MYSLVGYVCVLMVATFCLSPAFAKARDSLEMLAYPSIVLPSKSIGHIELKKIVRVFALSDGQDDELNPLLPVGEFAGLDKLSLEELDGMIRRYVQDTNLRLSGPRWINIVRPFSLTAGNSEAKRLGDLIAEQIEQQCIGSCKNVRVSPLRATLKTHIPSESIWSLKDFSIAPLKARMPVYIQWKTDTESGNFIVWYAVEADIRVFRAKASVPRSAYAAPGLFREAWTSLSSLGGVPPVAPDPTSRTTGKLRRGQILYAKNLEVIPQIEFGSIVSVVSRYRSVEIRTRGKALDTAYLGDTTKIESLSSKQTFWGRVADKDLVVVTNTSVGH